MGLARRLAQGALQRLAREVERHAWGLEPLRAGIALREPAPPASATPSPSSPSPSIAFAPAPTASREAPPPPQPSAVAAPPGVELVTHLRASLERPLARLREAQAWARSEDPAETIRRARVATRRLRAFARLFAPMLGDERPRKLERRLRTITRGVGPLREWDVLLASLRAQHATAEPLARAALEHLVEWAEGKRRKAARRADEALAKVDAVALAEALDAELDRVCGRLLRLPVMPSAHASALLEPELARAFEGMPRPRDDADLDALHDVRIRAKRLRYALELLRPVLGPSHRPLRPLLERVQSTIGEHREAAQLVDRLQERRTALADRGLHTLASALDPVHAAALHRRQLSFEAAMQAFEALVGHPRGGSTSDPPG